MTFPTRPPRWAAVVEDTLDWLQAVWNRPGEDGGLPTSPSQLRAMTIVGAHGQTNLGRLAAELGTVPSAASRLCDRMVAAGFLEREPNPASRREVVLRLSPQGCRLLTRLHEQRVEAVTRVMAAMTPQEQRSLVSGLTAFQAAARNTVAPDDQADVDLDLRIYRNNLGNAGQ